jgi:hypothetical protein
MTLIQTFFLKYKSLMLPYTNLNKESIEGLLVIWAIRGEISLFRNPKKIAPNNVSEKIAVAFISIGIISITFSVYSSSQTLAFISLGLTFWGGLFLLISPKKYVEESFLVSTAIPEYISIDKIIKEMKYVERGYYIPAYPKDALVPEHLSGLGESIVFVSASNAFAMPSLEDISQGKFWVAHKKGVLLTPPGLGLLNQILTQLKSPITKTDINQLFEILPRIIIQNFAIAKDLTMKAENENIYVVIKGSVFKNLYVVENSNSILFLGCPLISAIACLLAQSTGKTITIKETTLCQDGLTIETTYQYAG